MKHLTALSLLAFVALPMPSLAPGQTPGRFFGARGVLMPAPLGTYVNGWHDAQAVAAEANAFVIYRQEWFQDGTTLGPYGSHHLRRIAQHLPRVPFQVVIQADQRGEKTNLARQTYIVDQLLAAGIADAPARVVVANPTAEGLYGDQAAQIFLQTFSGTSSGAGGASGHGGGGSSFGGGSGISGGGLMGGFRGY